MFRDPRKYKVRKKFQSWKIWNPEFGKILGPKKLLDPEKKKYIFSQKNSSTEPVYFMRRSLVGIQKL